MWWSCPSKLKLDLYTQANIHKFDKHCINYCQTYFDIDNHYIDYGQIYVNTVDHFIYYS